MPRSLDRRYIYRQRDRWRVIIQRQSPKIRIEGGAYASLEDAIRARDRLMAHHQMMPSERVVFSLNRASVYSRRSVRLQRVSQFIASHQGAFRQIDIARAVGLSKTTVHRLMPYLEKQGIYLQQDRHGMLSLMSPYTTQDQY